VIGRQERQTRDSPTATYFSLNSSFSIGNSYHLAHQFIDGLSSDAHPINSLIDSSTHLLTNPPPRGSEADIPIRPGSALVHNRNTQCAIPNTIPSASYVKRVRALRIRHSSARAISHLLRIIGKIKRVRHLVFLTAGLIHSLVAQPTS
jgi:hypothetical protein